MQARLAKIRKFLVENQLDAVVIDKLENVSYFSGFRGADSLVLITQQHAQIITDFRYVEQAEQEAKLFDIIQYEHNLYQDTAVILQKMQVGKIGFEGDSMCYNQFLKLTKFLQNNKLMPVELDIIRVIKDDAELIKLKKAVAISDAAFTHILTVIKPGMSEIAVAGELENCMRRLGSEKPAFDTIVASGVRGSLPHGLASKKFIEKGDLVTMDFGAVYQGYHSDITRTICVGRATAKQREIYDMVLKAQLTGVQQIKPGQSGREIDAIARRVIINAGYGKFFGHGLGHGVGLAIHELPRLSPTSTCDNLMPGMVVTVEPGIYLPDWGGVRIEDTVVITNAGCDILTSSNKQLIEME